MVWLLYAPLRSGCELLVSNFIEKGFINLLLVSLLEFFLILLDVLTDYMMRMRL